MLCVVPGNVGERSLKVESPGSLCVPCVPSGFWQVLGAVQFPPSAQGGSHSAVVTCVCMSCHGVCEGMVVGDLVSPQTYGLIGL